MKKLFAVTTAALIAYVILTSVMTWDLSAPAAAGSQTAEESTEPRYTVAAYEGRVAVYRGDTLLRLTDTPVEALPKADRVRLYDGIAVNSDKELKLLLEDFCS